MDNHAQAGKFNNIWQGEQVRLRAIEPDDWQVFNTWNLDSEMARFCYTIPFPTSQERDRRWASEQAAAEAKGDIYNFAIENRDKQLVGSINTHTCQPRNGTFGYGLAILREHWRKGYASEAILLVLRYFFLELRYQKVTVDVYEFNNASVRLHERLGFMLEGRLRQMTFTNGCFYDNLLFGMTKEEFTKKYPEYLKSISG